MSVPSRVRDVMTDEVVTATPATNVDDVRRLLVSRRISGLPVLDRKHHVVGIVSEADLMLRAVYGDRLRARYWAEWAGATPGAPAHDLSADLHRALGHTAGDVMTPHPVTVGPDATLEEAVHLMRSHHVKRLPVVDSENCLVGILCRLDVLKAIASDEAEAPKPEPAPVWEERTHE